MHLFTSIVPTPRTKLHAIEAIELEGFLIEISAIEWSLQLHWFANVVPTPRTNLPAIEAIALEGFQIEISGIECSL